MDSSARPPATRNMLQIARTTFDIILSKVSNPKGRWDKSHPGTRSLKNFALPMILCNLALEIEHLLEEDFLLQTIDNCIHEVMDVFYRPELGLVVENLTTENQLSDTFEGRVLNPGHAIEAMWFIMDLGERLKKPELIRKAAAIAVQMAEYGWDKNMEGYSISLTGMVIRPSSSNGIRNYGGSILKP